MAVPKSNSFCYKFNKWINFFTGITLAQEIQANSPSTLLKDFKTTLHSELFQPKIDELMHQVEEFAATFPMPGK